MSAVPDPSADLVVRAGRLLCYRLFDVADEIDLAAASRALREGVEPWRGLSADGSASIAITKPPLAVRLGSHDVRLPRTGFEARAQVGVRLFDYGVASAVVEIPIEAGTRVADLIAPCDELYESEVIEAVARTEVDGLLDRVAPALQGRHGWRGVETYTVLFVTELDGRPTAAQVLEHAPVLAALLLGEPGTRRLSAAEVKDVVTPAWSYFEDDLAIVDWNSAFVLEPSGSRDVPEVLEFATSHLLELRYHDEAIDAELGRLWDEFEAARRRPLAVLWSPYPKLARDVLQRLMELTEFTERVDNSVKVIGDFYLARLYRESVQSFRIPAWQANVSRKIDLVGRTYGLLKGNIEVRRGALLELTIVLLIVFEIAWAMLGRG